MNTLRIQTTRLCLALMPCLLLMLAAEITTGSVSAMDQWSQFRGDQMDGQATTEHPVRWSESENVAWVADLEGEGWSCPVVWNDLLFVTEAVPVGEEAIQPDATNTGGDRRRNREADPKDRTYRLQVVCLDAKTGEERWRQTAREGRPVLGRHSSNTYATETPVTDGKYVYAYFGMMGVYCFDINGELVWQRDLGNYPMRAEWGTSSSPILFDNKLYLQIDNESQSFLVALDAQTGKDIWRVDREESSQYSSPVLWRNSQRAELIVGGTFCRSYDPNTGDLLWQLNMEKGRSSATPLALNDRLYVGTEYRNRGGADDGGGFLFAIKPGGSGDLTPSDSQDSTEFVSWKVERSGIQMASPAYCNGYLYLLERRSGVVHCIDAKTGEKAYQKRIPGARAFWASPWTMGDQVFCVDTNGTTFVLRGGPNFEVIAENEIDELTWSTPAIANEALYFRTAKHLFCIRK
ncbi:PQQ-binding-like beta-propeller repeat protein [Rhodopirellula sp. JC737]|nr:PQQ-binding-like beta-propeller repeat protein [Rhodopirellula sp. JC737]